MSSVDRSDRLLAPHPAVRAAVAYLLAVDQYLLGDGDAAPTLLPESERALSLEAVEACEEAVGGHLTDEVLSLLAAESDPLTDQREMQLALVGSHTERAHDCGASRSLIAFGNDGHLFFCAPKNPSGDDRRYITIFDEEDRSERRVDLAGWLGRCAEERLDDVELDEAVQEMLESDDNVTSFAPRLVSAKKHALPTGPARRVRHKKFGDGTVLRDLLDGDERKVEIAFDGAGQKTLLARFVDDI